MKMPRWFIGFFATALMLAVAPLVPAAELDCAQMLNATVAKHPSNAAVGTAQKQLIQLGFKPGKVDGLLGPETRGALKEFCANARFAWQDDLLVMLSNHVAIAKAYPDWTKILGSKDFAAWETRQSDAAQIRKTRQYGDSSSVIALLDRYFKRKDRQELTPLSWTDDDAPVSFHLTENDLKQLKTRETLSSRIGNLLGKSYGDKEEFEAAAGAALKGVAEPDDFIRLMEKYAEQQNQYKITKGTLDELRVVNVPEYILDALQDIENLDYSGSEIGDAVDAVLGGLSDRAAAFKPELVKLAVITPSGGALTDKSLAKFADAHHGDALAAAVLEKLAKLQGKKYKNNAALAEAVNGVLQEINGEIDDSHAAIVSHAQGSSAYVLDKAQVREVSQKVKDSAVPEIFLVLLGGLQDVDYPDAVLFWRAAKARVEIAGDSNSYRQLIWNAVDERHAVKVDQAFLDDLKALKLPQPVIDQVAVLQGREFDNSQALKDGINGLFRQLGRELDQYRETILAQATKRHFFDKAKTVQWSGNGCGCVRRGLSGTVYGLYPFWMAGEKQTIDFSYQSRIGYYGLSFDDKGNVTNTERWSGLDTSFIRKAREYGTRVDLVIYRDNWDAWKKAGKDEKTALFRTLAANIVSLVRAPLTDTFSKVKPYIAPGEHPPVMGDGVTLYFSGYPQDEDSVNAFHAFINDLREKLDSPGRPSFVNIMFRSTEMGSGVYGYDKLLKLVPQAGDTSAKSRSLFLVLLQEPTTTDKKVLRANVEIGLHGEERLRLLRNIVTVLTYDGRSKGQLEDDIIYAKDNFGGIGFWTQPLAAAGAAPADESVTVAALLDKRYLAAKHDEASPKAAVCRIVCPNKWIFRIAWDVFMLLLVAGVVLYFSACEWRVIFRQYFLYYIAGVVVPAVLLGFALLFCDPFLAGTAEGNGPLILVVSGVIAYAVWNYYDKKKKADLP